MKSLQPDRHRLSLSAADMQSSNYLHYPPFRPTLPTYKATLLLAFNLRIAAYLTPPALTLAGAVTHSPPPILARADEDVVENIDSFFFLRDFQLCQLLQGKFHQTDDSRQKYEVFTKLPLCISSCCTRPPESCGTRNL